MTGRWKAMVVVVGLLVPLAGWSGASAQEDDGYFDRWTPTDIECGARQLVIGYDREWNHPAGGDIRGTWFRLDDGQPGPDVNPAFDSEDIGGGTGSGSFVIGTNIPEALVYPGVYRLHRDVYLADHTTITYSQGLDITCAEADTQGTATSTEDLHPDAVPATGDGATGDGGTTAPTASSTTTPAGPPTTRVNQLVVCRVTAMPSMLFGIQFWRLVSSEGEVGVDAAAASFPPTTDPDTGEQLYADGTIVTTGPEAAAVLTAGGWRISMAEGSEVRLGGETLPSGYLPATEVRAGDVLVEFTEPETTATTQRTTPLSIPSGDGAACELRITGTRLEVSAGMDGTTVVRVYEGTVDAVNAGETVEVAAGRATSIREGQPPSAPEPLDADAVTAGEDRFDQDLPAPPADEGVAPWVWFLAGLVVAAVVAGAFLLGRRGRRTPGAPSPDDDVSGSAPAPSD